MTLLEKLKAGHYSPLNLERVTHCVGLTQEEADNLPVGALIENRVGNLRGYYVFMGPAHKPNAILNWRDATLSKEHRREMVNGEWQMRRGDTQVKAQPFCGGNSMLVTGKSPCHDSIKRIA